MEQRIKSGLENEIALIFKKNAKKGMEDEVAGVINGVIGEYFRQLETGNRSEIYPAGGYSQREENKDEASNVINGFMWAMYAAGMMSEEERKEMAFKLNELRFRKQEDAYYAETNDK